MLKQEDLDMSIKDVLNKISDDNTIHEKKICFEDIIGYEKEKEELLEIRDFFLSNEKYEQVGARIPRGILLVGQAGCGKTMLVKALINEINIKSLVYNNTDSGNIAYLRNLFNKARESSPCLIFIDELDKLINSNSSRDKDSPFLRELLVQLDGFDENNKIIVIATANTTLEFVPSLLRSGRFDRIINIRFPNQEERKNILVHYAKDKNISTKVNFDVFANMTSGLTGADLSNILNDASLISIRQNKKEIGNSEINLGIDRVMFNAVDKEIPANVKSQVAAHEAGHTLVAILRRSINDFSKVSIFNRGQTFGVNVFSLPDDELSGFNTKQKILDDIAILLGGYVSEQIICDDVSTGSSSDLSNARSLSLRLILKGTYGIKYITNTPRLTDLPAEKLSEIYNLSDKILKVSYDYVCELLSENKELLQEIAKSLTKKSTLFKEDLEKILAKYGKSKK